MGDEDFDSESGEFVAMHGPDGLTTSGAWAVGGCAELDVVDVDWLLVLVDGVRHFYVGHDETSVMEMESTMRNFLCRMSWNSGEHV